MPEEFDRQKSFGWMINVIANKSTKDFDTELKEHGLSIALWPTMMCLWEEEGVTQRDIAAKSKVENSTTTRTLDKLEKLELVERRADPNSTTVTLPNLLNGKRQRQLRRTTTLPNPQLRLNKELRMNELR
eukprot:TRINITY_DN23716_c0_g1_i1.p1 TRINITY_DN23716_c0_g1~~TRINITY_DN23716_c0_g1_i1.p1  ORF type:complete len:130 (+),score=17.60 TRINITY_DN23716_c0_g1_i1:23-412(+)